MPVTLDGTKGITNATWTTAGRPSAPSTGQQGWNTTLGVTETYNGTLWVPVGNQSIIYIASYLIVAGGAGGYINAIITSLSSTYSYAIGAGGNGGNAGTGGGAGGAGGSGVIYITAYFG
jgi:hypothetical protein